jgi:hypothetical protein
MFNCAGVYIPLPSPTPSHGHLPEPVHLTVSLSQLLKGIESEQKLIDWLCQTSYIKSALKFQVFK